MSWHFGGLGSEAHDHPARLDKYHCHTTVPTNTDLNAPVKKGRENICHDRRSPEHRYLRYFIGCNSMNESIASGGVEYRH